MAYIGNQPIATAITNADISSSAAIDLSKLATSGDLSATNITASTGFTLGSTLISATGAELNYNDITALGTVEASKVVTADANGDITFPDNEKLKLGTGGDLQIYHDGSHSRIYDASAGELKIMSNGAAIRLQKDNGENMLLANTDGAVNIYYDGSAKLATTATGIDVTGNATFADNGKAIFGAGSDMLIYHDGSNSYIKDVGTGYLNIITDGSDIRLQKSTGEYMAKFVPDGTATLYYDNSAKFATTATGVDVTGALSATTTMTVQNGSGTEGVQLRYNENGGEISLHGTNGNDKTLIDYLDGNNDGNGLTRILNLGAGNEGVQIGIANASNTGGITLTTGNNVTRQHISDIGDIYTYQTDGSTVGMFWDASESVFTVTGKLDVSKGIVDTTTTVSYASSIALTLDNGAIQTVTLTGNATFTDSLNDGEAIVLMLNGGASHTVTWTAVTKWVTGSGNAAPTLTASDAIILWKIGSSVYAATAGSFA